MVLGRKDRQKSARSERVAHVIRSEIDHLLRREIKDPLTRDLSVTEVVLRPDLKQGCVRVVQTPKEAGMEPSEDEQLEILSGLKRASPFIQSNLRKRLQMRMIPQLRFEYDVRIASMARVWALTKGS